MKRPLSLAHRGQQGFSLVELMIAIALGGLIIAAVGTVYVGSRQSFRTQDAMARIQEGARYAFETMSYDIRQVGLGCETVNTDPVDSTWYNNLFKRPLLGYESGSGLPADVTDVVADTDALMVLRADKRGEVRLTSAATTATDHGIGNGGLAVVTEDYSDATVYTASGASGTSITLGTALNCSTGVAPTADYRLLPLVGHIYHIRENGNGVPSLYRETLLADGTTEAQEVIEGVEDMQIEYGEDTSQVSVVECPDDGCSADTYRDDAGDVTNWNRVVSVRITLTMRSAETGAGVGGDGFLRKTFTTTIAVRNRL
ncbi:MAG: PilW family protein [Pseudomonadota bacterium]